MSKLTYTYERQGLDVFMTLYVDDVKYHAERTYCHPCQLCSLMHNCHHPLKTLCNTIDVIAADNNDDDRLIFWTKA